MMKEDHYGNGKSGRTLKFCRTVERRLLDLMGYLRLGADLVSESYEMGVKAAQASRLGSGH